MPRTKVNPVERVALQRRIAAARATDVPWAVIARQEGHPIRTLQHMHERWLEQRAAYDDPHGVIEHALNLYDELLIRLGDEIAYADHSSARVGALRTLMDLIARRLNLLILVGKLPHNYADFAEVPGAREMIRRMGEVIERHDLPVEVLDDMLAIIEEEPKAA